MNLESSLVIIIVTHFSSLYPGEKSTPRTPVLHLYFSINIIHFISKTKLVRPPFFNAIIEQTIQSQDRSFDMSNYKIIIAYDGTRYRGWQRLTNGADTIQGKLENVLSRMTGEEIQVIGAGRTDGGAHARAQVANFHTKFKTNPTEIFKYCAEYLPKDITLVSVKDAAPRFHARFHAISRRYVYQIRTGLTPNPFENQYRLHIAEALDVALMEEAATYLMGHHDFSSFTSRKSKTKPNERTITRLEILRDGNNLDIVCEADGFLHNMVRIITGTLIEVGLGKVKPSDVKQILSEKVRADAGYTVPSHGLFLDEVLFD